MIFRSSSLGDTKEAAKLLAGALRERPRGKRATVVSLIGDLGSGKTTFVKRLAAALGVRTRVSSPTFLLLRSFKLRDPKLPFKKLYHLDAYRLKGEEELAALGFPEIIADPNNLVFVEWADRVRGALPKRGIRLDFYHGKRENERIIKIDIKNGKRKASSSD